jgi:hypothetical protein
MRDRRTEAGKPSTLTVATLVLSFGAWATTSLTALWNIDEDFIHRDDDGG